MNVLVQRDSIQRQGRSVRISFELEKHRGLECDGPVNLLNMGGWMERCGFDSQERPGSRTRRDVGYRCPLWTPRHFTPKKSSEEGKRFHAYCVRKPCSPITLFSCCIKHVETDTFPILSASKLLHRGSKKSPLSQLAMPMTPASHGQARMLLAPKSFSPNGLRTKATLCLSTVSAWLRVLIVFSTS